MSLPIYISLTSIFQNQDELLLTLKSILNQSLKPNAIYLYLSSEPYLLDKGFAEEKITNSSLLNYISTNHIIIKWVKNIGPYRKLLPLLKDKWNEDCLIITVDDDTEYHKDLVNNLYNDYIKYGCVINYRGFTPSCTTIQTLQYNNNSRSKTIKNQYIYNFPTGKGGILYHPKFFHKTGDIIFNEDYFNKACPTNDDIWFCLLRIYNKIDCYIDNKPYMVKDNTNAEFALCVNYNNKDNLNNKYIKNCIDLFSKLWPA